MGNGKLSVFKKQFLSVIKKLEMLKQKLDLLIDDEVKINKK